MPHRWSVQNGCNQQNSICSHNPCFINLIGVNNEICGINNRNLKNFVVDLKTTERLAAMVPKDCILVSESGMQTHEDLAAVRKYGADAVLIGETLMRSGNIAVAMQQLRENL